MEVRKVTDGEADEGPSRKLRKRNQREKQVEELIGKKERENLMEQDKVKR